MEEDVVDWETDRAVEVRNGCRLGIGLMVSVELGEKAMASTTREENATAADRLFIMLLFFLVVVAGCCLLLVRFFFFTSHRVLCVRLVCCVPNFEHLKLRE